MRGKIAFLTVFLACCFPLHSQDQYLSTEQYFSTLKSEIGRAKKSITACIYLFPLFSNDEKSRAMQLANALSEAAKRGVKVEVVLDDSYNTAVGGDPEKSRNLNAYAFLKSRGIDVHFDNVPATVHSKVVVIDEAVVIAGSSNWSEAALARNKESSLLVRSREAAAAALADIRGFGRKEPSPETAPGAYVPPAFIDAPACLGKMVNSNDERSFDIYLALLSLSAERPANEPLAVNYDSLADTLGIASMGSVAYRRQITKVLRKLQNKYGLITATIVFGSDAQVSMISFPGEDGIPIPRGYWTYGWNRRLEFAGKAMYLLGQRYAATSPIRPRWSLAVDTITRRHGISPAFVTKGTTVLRRANLVEVEYDDLNIDNFNLRRPSIYTPEPLYDPQKLEAHWAELEARHGKEKLDRARRCAALVYEDSDSFAVEVFIGLENQYGQDIVRQAYNKIAAKRPDNPLRKAGYLINTIKSMGEQK